MNFLKRPLVFCGIPFLLATATASVLFSTELSMTLFVVSFILSALFLILFFILKRAKTKFFTLFCNIGIILASISIGFLLFTSFYQKIDLDFSRFDKEKGDISGIITEVSEREDNNVRYTIKVTSSTPEDKRLIDKKVYIYSKADTIFSYGQEISTKTRFATPTEDAERYMKEQGVFLSCFSSGIPVLKAEATPTFLSIFKDLNRLLCKRVDSLLQAPFSKLIKAMLLGDTSELDTSTTTVFMKGGLSHVFSVSGLHIAIMSSLIAIVISAFGLPMIVKNSLSILAVWGLVLITGFELPACRSGVMMTVFLIAPLLKRDSDPITALTLASILVALQNPLSIISLSFLLTVFSTAGILLFSRRIAFGIKTIFKIIPDFIVSSLSVTLASNLAILPISLLFFKGISLISPITNLLLLPILPILMGLSILLLIFGSVPVLSVILAQCVKALISTLLFSSSFLSNLPFSYLGLDYPFLPIWLLGCTVLAVLCFIFFYEKKGAFIKRKHYKTLAPTFAKTALLMAFVLLANCSIYTFLARNSIKLQPIATNDGMAVLITQKKDAIVVSLKNDMANEKQMINLFLSKNSKDLLGYLSLDNKDKESDQKGLLLSYYKPRTEIFFQNELYEDFLSYQNRKSTVICPDGYGYNIGIKTTGFSLYGESAAVTQVGDKKILYTNSVNIAKNYSCDVLFFGGDFEKIVGQTKSECVILLEDILKNQTPIYLLDK